MIRWRRRLIDCALVVAMIGLSASACSVADTIGEPWCSGDRTSALIVAQSVPTATEIPCLDELPSGWEVETIRIVEDGSTLEFASDRAGSDAATLHFAEFCEIGTAISTRSEYPRVERFEEIISVSPAFVAKRIYRFEGGCFWWEFRFDEGAPAGLSIELGNALTVISREAVNDNLRETFVDEDL